MNVSFKYEFEITPPPAGNTRDPVLIDLDFAPVYAANPGKKAFLEFVSLSGSRENTAGDVDIIESFSARLIGDFAVNNLPLAAVAVPRPGDTIVNFDGWVFSQNFPLDTGIELPQIPPNFQLEFQPSSRAGNAVGDKIIVSFTIGFRVL